MVLTLEQLDNLSTSGAGDAWQTVISEALSICSEPLTGARSASEATKRDRLVGQLDHFLAAAGWDMWEQFGEEVERNSDHLVNWWKKPFDAKAILVLDGLSIRELPWLIEGAKERGFTLHDTGAFGAELPSETNAFAKSLGFNSRSQLQNNGGGMANRLAPVTTECIDLPWKDCANLIDSSRNWIFWHHWPDSKLHDGAGAGQGLDVLTRDIAAQLTSDDFWEFVEKLATGRRVIITSDHGYAATGMFFDAANEQAVFLKSTFKSGRLLAGTHDPGPFTPPVALQTNGPHGPYLMALGRWKWKSQGGYPTLAHGGLSLLEMLCPSIEITK